MISTFIIKKPYGSKALLRKRTLLLLPAIMLFILGYGQPYTVNINITVTPPYPTKVTYYTSQPDKILVFFTDISTTDQQIYVQGEISGENGIRIYTDPAYKMPQAIVLKPGVPYRMTRQNVEEVFNYDHLKLEGISKNEVIYGNGLPEGSYTICMKALDYETGEQLSAEAPQGCSNTFIVSDIEPPVVLNPVCGDTVKAKAPQNLLFTWTRPPGVPVNVQFNLKIIEVLPTDRNINDAVQSATHPVFFETNSPTTMCMLGPADPQLVAGKTYAFVITVYDPANQWVFRNNGMSEVCSFIYAEPKPSNDIDEGLWKNN
jgi:TANFOR domain-containing protein